MNARIISFLAYATLIALLPTAHAQGTNSDLKRAQALLAAGNYRGAADAFTQVIARAPNESPAYQGRGQARVGVKDYAGAIKDYDRALELDPTSATLYNLRGIAKKASGDPEGAMADYGRAIELSPNFAAPLADRAFLRWASGDTEGAIADFNRTLELAPENELALFGRVSLKCSQRDLAGAMADANALIKLDPKSAEAYVTRGLVREALGERTGALEDYQAALARNPTFQDALPLLKTARERIEALQGAVGAAAAAGQPAPARMAVAQPAQSEAPDTLPPGTLPPPGSPTLALPVRLDINLVSATQYAGDVSATVEAMRAIQGPLSSEDQKKFDAKWAPFFRFPASECTDYFKKLNPLLQEYLHLRASIPGITTEMAAAWREAVMLSSYKNEAAVREALGEARVQEQLLQGVNARMAEIMRQVEALGDPPDATQAKARVRKHHDEAVAATKQVLPTFNLDPASQTNAPGTPCVFTPRANRLPAGLVVKWDFGDGKRADTPVQAMEHAYAKEGEFSVTAQLLDGKTHAVLTTAAVKARITAKAIKGVWALQKVDRTLPAASNLSLSQHYTPPPYLDYQQYLDYVSEVGDGSITNAFSPNSVRTNGNWHHVVRWADQVLNPTHDKGKILSEHATESEFSVSYDPLPKTLAEGAPFKLSGTLEVTRNGSQASLEDGSDCCGNVTSLFSFYIKFCTNHPTTYTPTGLGIERELRQEDSINLQNRLGSAPVFNLTQPGTQSTKLESKMGHVAPAGKLGDTWTVRFITYAYSRDASDIHIPYMTEDYTYVFQPEGTAPVDVTVTGQTAEPANQYRIDEINTCIASIDKNLSRLRAERSAAKSVSAANELDYQIMQAQTEKLAEQDELASLQTGHDVHTRSPFDDYAQQTFIANTREEQLVMAEAQREVASLFKFTEVGDDPDGMRDFIQRELVASGAIARGDFAAIRKVANALNNRVVGYWQGEQAKSEEKAINAEENIMLANSAITACTIVASSGMSELGAVYAAPSWVGTAGTMTLAGTTGYVSTGSPKEALKQGIAWSCTIGNVATSMYDGYQDGGGWSGALTGAGQGLAIGWITGKASELAVAKWGNGPSFKTPPLRERPLTVEDFINSKEFRQAQEAGISKVRAFEDAQAQLQGAGRDGVAPERIQELQDIVKARANDINADQHAKMFLLKSGQGNPASIRAYESYHRAIHAEVEARFHEIMETDMGFNPQEVVPVRNSTSTGTAGMDYDLALKEGQPITRNGQLSSVSEWQEAAREAYNKAFQEKTGHSAEKAWENVTSSVHVESYKDIGNTPGRFEGWLNDLRNPQNVKMLKSELAQQATDVTRVKAWDFQNNETMGEFSKLQEICRGTAKDMKTKLDPVLAAAKTSTAAQQEAVRQARAHWRQVQEVMEDFGSNRIGPITAKQRLYLLTGRESVHEIIDEIGVTMQGAVQFGQ